MKLFFKFLCGIVLVLIVIILALPSIISLKSVHPSLVSELNATIPGHIEVKDYSISWFKGITIYGFQLKDPQGELVLEFQKFETDTHLLTLLLDKKLSKKAEIEALNAHIVMTPSGKTNLEESLGSNDFLKHVTPLLLSNANLQLDPSSELDLTGLITINKLSFPDNKVQHVLSNLKIVWKYDTVLNDIEAKLSGNIAKNGEIAGEILFNHKSSSLYAFLRGSNIPAHFFELASGTNFFEPIFGESIETNLEFDVVNMDGSVNVQLKGQNGLLDLKGNVVDGILTLTDPFYVETEPNQKLAKELLKKYSPILGELQSGESRISLTVDPKGFSLPLFDFDLNKVLVNRAKVNLGKLTFNNKGDLKKAAKFLNAPSSDKMIIWFTPQFFSLSGGRLDLARTDFLIQNSYPLAVWGSIDFARNYVDAMVALSDTTLNRAFGIKGMSPNTFLQLPLKGKIDRVKIDTTQAMTKIASLLAKQQGATGMLLGVVLDIAQGSNNEKTPAPTTNPLPWADQIKTADRQESKNSTQKQIESAAKDLFKGIF
jgi:hypothetical protein